MTPTPDWHRWPAMACASRVRGPESSAIGLIAGHPNARNLRTAAALVKTNLCRHAQTSGVRQDKSDVDHSILSVEISTPAAHVVPSRWVFCPRVTDSRNCVWQ
jgi:hypothetical protein